MEPLSAYILTNNSEEFIGQILDLIEGVVDEIVLLDSGSTDRTREIAEQFEKVRWHVRALDNFTTQRNFALDLCSSQYVLFLDSDEVPDKDFIQSVAQLREAPFTADAYYVQRDWVGINGRVLHCLYPVSTPDRPIRLVNKHKCRYVKSSSNFVHETLTGHKGGVTLPGRLHHHTFRTRKEIARKLELYTDLAARDLLARGKKPSWRRRFLNPFAAFFKWYFIKKGYLDGWEGLVYGMYAFNYTREKYRKAARLPAPEPAK